MRPPARSSTKAVSLKPRSAATRWRCSGAISDPSRNTPSGLPPRPSGAVNTRSTCRVAMRGGYAARTLSVVAGTVTIEQRGEIALVRIDRPPANAMDPEMLADGRMVLHELRAADPGAVVLTGRPGFFSAGVDLKLAPTLDRDGQRTLVEGI